MIEIVFEEEKLRTVARDGDRFVGECDCSAGSGVWTAYHTAVDPAYGGQGIAGRLVAKLAEAACERGVKIMPTCSYVVRLFDTKPEFAGVDARKA